MPTITFTSGVDSYTVTGTDSYELHFLAGDDVVDVRGGTFTTAYMGSGNDQVSLRSGDALLHGEAGADRFDIYGSGFEARGGLDNDFFYLRGGSDLSLFGDDGDDRFNFVAGGTGLLLRGGGGNDDFFGYAQAISGSIYGDAGNDYFVGFSSASGSVALRGGPGYDVYRYHVGTSAVFFEEAGEGIDSVQVARGVSYALPANLERISVSGFSGSTSGAATLTGNALANSITAHNNADTLFGLDGDDRLYGKAADDILWAGNGNDYLDGGLGNDALNGEADNDTINGRAGDDAMSGGAGNDSYYVDSLGDTVVENADEGTDTVRVSVSDWSLPANVENGIISGSAGLTLTGNVLANVLTGATGNDILVGLAGIDTLRGGGGNDVLDGGASDDVLDGGAGDDQLSGGVGEDMMRGGGGNDTYFVNVLLDQVSEGVADGTDTVQVSVSGFTLPDNVENGTLLLSTGGTLLGNIGSNVLVGGAGDDWIEGSGGGDTLYGGDGNDHLRGNVGAPYGGHDRHYGGAGADHIESWGADSAIVYYLSVTDSPAGDGTYDFVENGSTTIFDLSAIDANTGLAGDQAFTIVDVPTGAAGELWVESGRVWAQRGVFLLADVDGGGADLVIHIGNDNVFGGSQLIL